MEAIVVSVLFFCLFFSTPVFETLKDLFIKQVWFYLFPFDLPFSPFTIQTSLYVQIICASAFNLVFTKVHKHTYGIGEAPALRLKEKRTAYLVHFKVLEAFSHVPFIV